MSDFDKEAEREKLREKYERDKAEREATQRMSDLLLKGARMTNSHCGTCGDPLFEQDETTFCPSCHGNPDAVRGTDLEAQPAEEPPTTAASDPDTGTDDSEDQTTSPASAEESSPSRDPPTAANDPAQSTQPAETDSRASESTNRSSPSSTQPTRSTASDRSNHPSPSHGDAARDTDTNRAHQDDRRPSRGGSPSPSTESDLETARESLVVALEKFARNAAETDDPRYAKECLEAAREAGETLDVLR